MLNFGLTLVSQYSKAPKEKKIAFQEIEMKFNCFLILYHG